MIIMFGPAGSGKSTQGQTLAELFGWKWLSVGRVLRETGEYEKILRGGNLVDDDTVIALMQKEIAKADADGLNLIVDGYPRNAYQAKWVKEHIADEIEGMIVLEVPKAELFKRLEERGRSDDGDKAVIEHRWEIYEREIAEILTTLKNLPLKKVNGVGTVEEVTKRLERVVMELAPEAELQKDDVNGGEIEKSYGE